MEVFVAFLFIAIIAIAVIFIGTAFQMGYRMGTWADEFFRRGGRY